MCSDRVVVVEAPATIDLGERFDAIVTELDWLDGRGLAGQLQELERLARKVEAAIVSTVAQADRRIAVAPWYSI